MGTELEYLLEGIHHDVCNSRLLHTRLRTAGISAYVPTAYRGFPLESYGCCAIHGRMYSGPGLQQLHLVCIRVPTSTPFRASRKPCADLGLRKGTNKYIVRQKTRLHRLGVDLSRQ